MKFLKLLSLALACTIVPLISQAFVQISTVTALNTPLESCTPSVLEITGSLGAVNYTFNGVFITVTGNTIDIDVDYTSPGIILPAIGSFTHNANLGNLAAGTYTVNVNGVLSGSVSSTMTITISVASCCPFTPGFTASDTAGCPGELLSMTNNTTSGATSYTWKDNGAVFSTAASPQLTLTNPGVHTITLIASDSSCTDSVSTDITVFQGPQVNLGSDTTLCSGESLILDAGTASTYTWSDNSTSQTLLVNTVGTYHVTATENSTGCSGSDTMNVLAVYAVASLNLGNDTSVCDGDSITLSAGSGWSSYQWNNLAATQDITVSNGFWSIHTVDSNNCGASDSILIGNYPIPNPNLPASVTECDEASLDAGSFNSYNWSTGAVDPTINVTTSGMYTVTVTDANTCTGSGSIDVTIEPGPVVDLGGDTTVCEGESFLLTQNEAGVSYLWYNSSNSTTVQISQPGQVWVEGTATNGCVNSDTIEVTYIECNTGIEEFATKGNLELFPNPTADRVSLNLQTQDAWELQVLDLTGRTVIQEKGTATNGTITIAVDALPAGLYVLEIRTGDQQFSGRFVRE